MISKKESIVEDIRPLIKQPTRTAEVGAGRKPVESKKANVVVVPRKERTPPREISDLSEESDDRVPKMKSPTPTKKQP